MSSFASSVWDAMPSLPPWDGLPSCAPASRKPATYQKTTPTAESLSRDLAAAKRRHRAACKRGAVVRGAEDYTFQAELQSMLSKCAALGFVALADEVELCACTLGLRMGEAAKAAPRSMGPPPPVPIRGAIRPTPGADLFGTPGGAAADFDLAWHTRQAADDEQRCLNGGGGGEGWEEHRDDDTDMPFFFNRTSGVTTWERPVGMAAGEAA